MIECEYCEEKFELDEEISDTEFGYFHRDYFIEYCFDRYHYGFKENEQ